VTKKIEFLAITRDEIGDAYRYYNRQRTGLGAEFVAEIRASAKRLARYPEASPYQRGKIRKYLLSRFPYKLLYAIRGEKIIIIAVAHQHRDPDYWVERETQV